jgi:phage terminase large subunit-like protein
MTLASQTLYELIKGRNLTAYPDDAIRLAVSRAVAIETSRGWRISKEKQSHKIDTVIALAIACHGAMQKQTSYNLYLPGLWE